MNYLNTYGRYSDAAAHRRFGERPLTEDELFRYAPSIFATDKHESRSERFQPIATIDIVRGLAEHGFQPFTVKQGKSRIEGKELFTKHLIRFRHVDTKVELGQLVPEIGLRNANDGTASYHLFLGLWRTACSNALVSDGKIVADCRVSHSGKRERVLDNVIEGTYRVLGEKDLVLGEVDTWRGITFDREQALAYGAGVRALRFGDAEGNLTPQGEAIEPAQLIRPRRIEDRGQDLYTLFNVAQEHALKGGIHGTARNANGQRRAFTTRAINGVEDDVKVNRALWAFTKALAEAA